MIDDAQNTLGGTAKGFYRIGFVSKEVAQRIRAILSTTSSDYEIVIDSDSIRHTLKKHGIASSINEAKRGQVPMIEADLLRLPDWLLTAATVKVGQVKQGKQPRIELILSLVSGTTIAILEWRPGRQQLALVTMYKKKPAA